MEREARRELMDRLDGEIRMRVGEFASIERGVEDADDEDFATEVLAVEPHNRDALSITVSTGPSNFTIGVGRYGNEWVLDPEDPATESDALRIIDAVAAGRAHARLGIGRSLMTLTTADDMEGRQESVMLRALLIPQFGWRRWGPVEQAAPYSDPPPLREPPVLPVTWRTRVWLRVVAVVYGSGFGVLAVLLPFDSRTEYPMGFLLIASSAAMSIMAFLLGFRPLVTLESDRTLRIRGLVTDRRVNADLLADVTATDFGVRFTTIDGVRATTVLFQDSPFRRRLRIDELLEAIELTAPER